MTELGVLTPRQISVASMVAKAWSNKRIAATLLPAVSERQVTRYIAEIVEILQLDASADARLQIALWYRERVRVSLAAEGAA